MLLWDEITKDVKEGILKEFLHADDLVLLGDRWWEVEESYCKGKKALNNKGLKIYVSKIKEFYTGQRTISASKIDPCSVCGKRVGCSFIKCVEY